ncbi:MULTISPECIES: OsmC family protein [Actinotignum]|uniref:OsmC family protein n=1 Tax=Actinotignum timonense TaxID=1870995 RepID=A0AAW9HC90_9ACTO|nr:MULTISPECIES: OsmC family protein [Actinotignum]MBS5748999.1 OsmC family protein [Actinotignum schaalii]MDE1558578.1 OsmC family protein [Actinotignum schaalii]MDE1663434.1 OsmC family protein [Actinotignum schaalii]MDK6372742.1 OsmC family protein [Actinotignum timonense]MDK6419634.1 OsmC family protein [Actinotignum timonense]
MAQLSARRIGHLHFTAVNDRGASVEIGKGPEQFTPGELMQLAVAGCQALSADSRFEQLLGEDYSATFTVSADADRENNRYTAFHTAMEVEFADMPEEQRGALLQRVDRAIARACTVGRTLDHPAPHDLEIRSAADN